MNKQKIEWLIEALYLYSNGLDNTHVMDNLTINCTDREWTFVCEMTNFINRLEVDNGLGTLCQVERVYSERENRTCRYPGVLTKYLKSDEENKQVIESLADEYTKKGIKFKL